ncbi:MFS transporter [Amycolatopsis sp.]|uniref:MFS transporter n=1 Tax=Amycolatopsis sp. TaxID=37632 RepID=UPI002B91FDB0|nr:MFS transporter [Amycolatopsis sp.]HVV14371.1 MFS transporter [Amycolatopsis sp.]
MTEGRPVLPVVLIATFMQLLDVTIAQVAIPSIQRDLHAGAGTLQLVLAGYTLAYACLLITAARLGDRFGYRRLFVIGMVVFTLASAGCAAAPTASVLVLARVLQGVGSGLMAPQVFSIIQTALPAVQRPRALSFLGATMGIASLTGPLLGAALLGVGGWRLLFLVNVPICLLALTGSVVLPDTRAPSAAKVDALGAFLAAAGLGLLVFPLSVGRELHWPLWTVACLVSALVLLFLFARSQVRGREPLLHPSVLRDRIARSGIALVFVFNAGVPSFTYLLFLYLQANLGYSALHAALAVAPFAAAAIFGSRAAPPLARRFGFRLLTAAAALLALVTAALAWRDSVVLPLLAVGGMAFGLFTASVFSLVLADVSPAATGSASGLLPTAQQLGGSIGLTLAGLVFAGGRFGYAMGYETVIFLVTAALTLVGSRSAAYRR